MLVLSPPSWTVLVLIVDRIASMIFLRYPVRLGLSIRGASIVEPMAGRITPSYPNPLLVPLHGGANFRCAVPQRESTSATVGIIGFRAVQQQIAMDRNLASPQFIVDYVAILFGVVDRLVENVVIIALARAIGHVSKMMRASYELHARITSVRIVDGEPHGGGF